MKMPKCGFISLSAACFMAGSAMATVSYTYENDDKTYVATVTSAETTISQEAINVLDSNAITNFVVRGTARLVVRSAAVRFMSPIQSVSRLAFDKGTSVSI